MGPLMGQKVTYEVLWGRGPLMGPLMGQRSHLWGRGPLMGQRATYGAEDHLWGHLWGRGSLMVPLMGQRATYEVSYGAEGDL